MELIDYASMGLAGHAAFNVANAELYMTFAADVSMGLLAVYRF